MSTKTNSRIDAANAIQQLQHFMPRAQLMNLGAYCFGEEGQFFIDKLVEFGNMVETMPKTYGQDGKGNQAVAYLHYFLGGMDWYITERDIDTDGAGQIQAFGLADLGYGAELGYISIPEIIDVGAELDLYFEPTTIENL